MAAVLDIVLDYLPEIVTAVTAGYLGFQVANVVGSSLKQAAPALTEGLSGLFQLIPLIGTIIALQAPVLLLVAFGRLISSFTR